MTFLPIVERELRVAARKRGTYRIRLGIAVVMVIVFVWMIGRPGWRVPATLGAELFTVLSMIGFAYSILVGVFSTSDCLSSEKREGTLGLLFLTDLRSYDVVCGKVFATSIGTFYALFAVFPIIGLPLLVGGVTGGEFGRMMIVLGSTMILSLSVGALVSALAREEWQAMTSTFVALLVITGVLPAIWETFFSAWKLAWLDALCLLPSCGFAYYRAFDTAYQATDGRVLFWSSIAVILGLALVSFISACVILPHAWRNGGRSQGRKADSYSSSAVRAKLLHQNPFLWLSLRLRGRLFWCALLGVLGLGFWTVFFGKALARKSLSWEFVVSMYGAFLLFALFKLFVAIIACRRLHEDRKSGALELLLATPLLIENVISGQEESLRRHCRIPIITLLMINTSLLALAVSREKHEHAVLMFIIICIGGVVTLFTDYKALVSLGMLHGLLQRRLGLAVLFTIGQVLVMPWVALVVLTVSGGGSKSALIFFVSLYFVATWVMGNVASLDARQRLIKKFRLLAVGAHNADQNSFRPGPVSLEKSSNT